MSAAHPATAPPAPACYLPSLQQNAPAIPAIALSTKLGHKTTHVVTEELKTGSLAGLTVCGRAGLRHAGGDRVRRREMRVIADPHLAAVRDELPQRPECCAEC